MQELSASLQAAKERAAALCGPLTSSQLRTLGAAVTALPSNQLQAVVALLSARCPTVVQPHTLPQVCVRVCVCVLLLIVLYMA
jgi:hypothetical protein